MSKAPLTGLWHARFKTVLDGLYKVAVGIDELRNRYGRDHAHDTPLRGLTERHARLAVHSGTAYCRFLLDTLADPAPPWHKKAPPCDGAQMNSPLRRQPARHDRSGVRNRCRPSNKGS